MRAALTLLLLLGTACAEDEATLAGRWRLTRSLAVGEYACGDWAPAPLVVTLTPGASMPVDLGDAALLVDVGTVSEDVVEFTSNELPYSDRPGHAVDIVHHLRFEDGVLVGEGTAPDTISDIACETRLDITAVRVR